MMKVAYPLAICLILKLFKSGVFSRNLLINSIRTVSYISKVFNPLMNGSGLDANVSSSLLLLQTPCKDKYSSGRDNDLLIKFFKDVSFNLPCP
jgi:hypothetical protein